MYKTLLFVFPNIPITENAEGGGGIVLKNHLQLLNLHFDSIYLLLIGFENEVDRFDNYFSTRPEELEEIKAMFVAKHSLFLSSQKQSRIQSYYSVIRNLKYRAFPYLNRENCIKFRSIVRETNAQLIWAEHLTAAMCSYYFTKGLKNKLVYAHHDWEYKLRKLRNTPNSNTISYRFRTMLTRIQERKLLKKVDGVICCSYTEYLESRSISSKHCTYIPVFVGPVVHKNPVTTGRQHQIFHLGGMQTTANRLGLEDFFRFCWTELKSKLPDIKLILIGSIKGATPYLVECFKDPNVIVKGYVADIDEVLEANCIHIIPWSHNTGARTKVPIVMRNRQAIVGMGEALKCFKELKNDENSILVNSFEGMISKIVNLLNNVELLEELSSKSFDTYKNHFTIDSQSKIFNDFVDSIN